VSGSRAIAARHALPRESPDKAMDTTIQLKTEFIRLGAALKLAGVVGSGGEAKHLIQMGLVHVNGKPDTRRGAKLRPGDSILLDVDPPVRIAVVAS